VWYPRCSYGRFWPEAASRLVSGKIYAATQNDRWKSPLISSLTNSDSMDQVFWLHDNFVGGRPGPNLIPWNLFDLRDAGIGAILSVNDGALVRPDDLSALDINYSCTPLSENAPPRVGDMETCLASLPKGYKFVVKNRDLGRRTLVHCRQGRDRTGMFLAYYVLKQFRVSPEVAIARVKECRSDALAAEGWKEFTLQVLRDCQKLQSH